jgi:hypothetical protein
MTTEHGTIMRAPEDIDKSVRQLVQEGRMEAALGTETPPGGRPKLALLGQSLAMRIRRGALGPAKVVLVPTGAGAVFTVGGFFVNAGVPTRWALAVNAGAAVLLCLALSCVGEELRVSAERVSRCWTWLGLRFGTRSVMAERVRDVIAAEQFSDARFRSVQIVSPGAVMHFGRALKPLQRRWVRDCIIAVISRGTPQPQRHLTEEPE